MTGPVPILVINLDRSAARLAAVQAGFGAVGLPFRRLPAVDAAALAPEAVALAYDGAGNARAYFAPLHAGEVACFLSHRRAWAAVAEVGAPFAAVFEDDAVPTGRLPGVLDALAGRPVDWDVVKLHGSSAQGAVRLGELAPGTALLRPWLVSLSGAAYCVSRRGAERLMAATAPFRRPLDVELQHWWEHGIDLYAVRPDAARVVPMPGGSTIGAHRLHGRRERLRREVGRPLFRARLALRSAWEGARRAIRGAAGR